MEHRKLQTDKIHKKGNYYLMQWRLRLRPDATGVERLKWCLFTWKSHDFRRLRLLTLCRHLNTAYICYNVELLLSIQADLHVGLALLSLSNSITV